MVARGVTGDAMRARAWGCMAQIGALGWLAVIIVATVVALPWLPRDIQRWSGLAALVFWVGTTIPAVLVAVFAQAVLRNRRLDGIFAAYGRGRATSTVGRGWATAIDGREVNLWFSKGPQLEIYVSCLPRTNAGIGSDHALAGAVLRASGKARIDVADGLVATGEDPAWVQAFASDPAVLDAVPALLSPDHALIRSLVVQPDAVKLTLRRFPMATLTAEGVARQVDALLTLAEVADRLPPPTQPSEPGGLLTRFRTNRGSVWTKMLVGGCLSVVLVGFFSAVAGLVVLLVG